MDVSNNAKAIQIDYFSEIQDEVDRHLLSCLNNTEEKLKHKLVILNNNSSLKELISFKALTILISGNLYGGTIVKYQIIIGNYKLKIDLLNIQKHAPTTLLQIGSGGFGFVYKIQYTKSKAIIAKRQLFRSKKIIKLEEKQIKPNLMKINEYLHKYSIYKICKREQEQQGYYINHNELDELQKKLIYLERNQKISTYLKIIVSKYH